MQTDDQLNEQPDRCADSEEGWCSTRCCPLSADSGHRLQTSHHVSGLPYTLDSTLTLKLLLKFGGDSVESEDTSHICLSSKRCYWVNIIVFITPLVQER